MNKFNSRFKILEKIGEGTFSDVLKCCETSTGNVYAAKKLKKEFQNSREAQNLSELVVLRSLPAHPNVLTLVEEIFDPGIGKLFMIFELMEMNLYDLIQRRKRSLPESKVKHLFYQILKGVDHLHSHGIFHRDLKPENILIKNATVKLADLGSVRRVHSPPPYTEYISTRWYRAPECMLATGTYGPKMDVWACGCVFYELLTSKPLFPGADEIDQLTKIHQVVGTPTPRVLLKMRRGQSRVAEVKFSPYPSINLAIILPFSTESARDLLKRMLLYDPDLRSNVPRLLDHKYFKELKEAEFLKQLTASNPYTNKQWPSVELNNLIAKKSKPRSSMSSVSSVKKTEKLATNSWGPQSTTSKISVAQSRSKPNNNLFPPRTVPKRKLLDRSSKTVQQKTPHVTEVTSSMKIPIKVQHVKSKTVGILPTLSRKPVGIPVSKSHVPGSSYKSYNPSFLPPIMEQ